MSVRALIALLVIAPFSALAGCDIENAGDVPPLGGLYFPNALALSAPNAGESRFLFVTSSNFDLRFNAGSLHAFSLDALEQEIADCDRRGLLGAQCVISSQAVLADEVEIPTFSTSVAVAPDGKRVFVGSRTRDGLTIIDVDPDADDAALEGNDPVASSLLGCGNTAARECEHVTGEGRDATTGATLRFPKDPSDIVTGPLEDLTGEDPGDGAQYIAVAHQGGAVSLFVDQEPVGGGDLEPALVSALGGLGVAPTGIARDPVSGVFYVSRVGNGLLRVGVAVAPDSSGDVPHDVRLALFSGGPLPIDGASLSNLRAIGFVPQSPSADMSDPGLGNARAGEALIVANSPSALALTRLSPNASGHARVDRLTEIGSGGSRITIGSIGGRAIAAVSCLDSREIYIVDIASMQVSAVVPNLSGPHGIAIDDARERLYVTDFRSSVVRVVDLSPLTEAGSVSEDGVLRPVRIIATLGTPRVVQELQ